MYCSIKNIFNSVGANLFAEDIPGALWWIEKEIDVLDEVIIGHGDFCALVASRGTTAAFAKAGCNHVKTVNKPTFSLLPSDLVNILAEARSVGNKFITHIWSKGGREIAGDEAWALIGKVWQFSYFHVFISGFSYYVSQYHFLIIFRVMLMKTDEPKLTLKLWTCVLSLGSNDVGL
jgi:hypothetical protein